MSTLSEYAVRLENSNCFSFVFKSDWKFSLCHEDLAQMTAIAENNILQADLTAILIES